MQSLDEWQANKLDETIRSPDGADEEITPREKEGHLPKTIPFPRSLLQARSGGHSLAQLKQSSNSRTDHVFHDPANDEAEYGRLTKQQRDHPFNHANLKLTKFALEVCSHSELGMVDVGTRRIYIHNNTTWRRSG